MGGANGHDGSDLCDLVGDDRITLWGLLLEVNHLLGRRLADDLATAFEYPEPWMEVLLRIARTPGQAVPMTQLASMVMFSSGGLTKLADRMEAEGLIRRQACPTDRRSLLATLTPKGRRVLERAIAVHLPSLDRHLVDLLDDDERVQLESILRKLRDGACAEAAAAAESASEQGAMRQEARD
jgi:DNA-binding MarR family transcriptional regulator